MERFTRYIRRRTQASSMLSKKSLEYEMAKKVFLIRQ